MPKEKMTGKKCKFEVHIDPLPPIFGNMAICMSCGKERHVNNCGLCSECWITFSHLREPKREERTE